MESEVQQYYGNKIRVRACGLCIVDGKILLVNHSGITTGSFWAPPGGGLKFGESAEDCLKREFLEETGLQIEVKDFLFVCELVKAPLHAIELFFLVHVTGGELKLGHDPEPGSPTIINEVKFLSWADLDGFPSGNVHGIFKYTTHPSNVDKLRGFFKL